MLPPPTSAVASSLLRLRLSAAPLQQQQQQQFLTGCALMRQRLVAATSILGVRTRRQEIGFFSDCSAAAKTFSSSSSSCSSLLRAQSSCPISPPSAMAASIYSPGALCPVITTFSGSSSRRRRREVSHYHYYSFSSAAATGGGAGPVAVTGGGGGGRSVAVGGMGRAVEVLPPRLSSSSLAIIAEGRGETLVAKIYRWLDVTGLLTRWNNRREWVMDLDSFSRIGAVMMTEYERKLLMFLGFHAYLFSILSIVAWAEAQSHFGCKPPCPKAPEYSYLNGRKRDFTWHSHFFFIEPKERCKECRWLEVDCKKECFERMKKEGHKFIWNGGQPLSTPRFALEEPHFHH